MRLDASSGSYKLHPTILLSIPFRPCSIPPPPPDSGIDHTPPFLRSLRTGTREKPTIVRGRARISLGDRTGRVTACVSIRTAHTLASPLYHISRTYLPARGLVNIVGSLLDRILHR